MNTDPKSTPVSSGLPDFISLPEDNFGVLVENEMDERRLLWLVNRIGEIKLRKSAAKRGQYPDSPLFVSTLLRRFRLKVPTHVYAEVRAPLYRVYVLVLLDGSAVKVGMTGDWPRRAYDFVRSVKYRENLDKAVIALFDGEKSMAFDASSQSAAHAIEKEIKSIFASHGVESPYQRGLINYGCGGHTEWFECEAYAQIVEHLSRNGTGISLHASLTWKDHMRSLDAAAARKN
ncbi:GIY-YIG nuclease family protein [Dyella kyungheensis]|uniref:GIY-YIG nuclease family protein n=1 Tax=Dyella kyungheensis TaxID=1242174 RepID=UPI003CF200B3